jgi:HSP20 family molecular chaperone IbpA
MSTKTDPTEWMWARACDLIGEAERLHRQFFRLTTSERALWEPPVDVFEDEREIVIVVAMPGVPAERVQVASGVRTLPFVSSRHRVRQLEIPHGAFERRIPLPQGRLDVSAPELIQGCLIVRLSKMGEGRS